MPGPAPPLPAGPPPAQPGYQDQGAAHAAAWAAYYQSQGQAAAGYAVPAAGAAQVGPNAPANPYANYGYSANAQQQHSQHASQPGYRPPVAQPYTAPAPPAQNYGAPAQPYQQQYQAGYQQQQQQQQQQQPYQWPQQQPAAPSQPYRPPQQHQQQQAPYQAQQPYYPPAQQQPYTPPNQPYRPSPSPGPNRPYQPSAPNPRVPSGPSRPPQAPNNFPPAKRPRFDGPNNSLNASRQSPVRPLNQPGFASPSPIPPRPNLPSAPRNANPLPPAPIPVVRPPIHLGLNGPPPSLPFGGPIRPVSVPLRGTAMRGRGGMVNAPRGPSGMRGGRDMSHPRHQPHVASRENDRRRKEKEKEREKDKEPKTTMTDFRIVGIEVKSLGWSWGMTSALEEAIEEVKEEEEATVEDDVKVEETAKEETAEATEEAVKAEEVPAGEATESKIKASEEATEAKTEAAESENVEEKRGEKRKAKTPEGDDDAGSSPKKRSGDYLETHRKANGARASSPNPTASHELNSNRFRIYFESPPEADRVPKALRRNPNKRWRRETSSVAPSVTGKQGQVGRESTVATGATLEETAEADVEVKGDAAAGESAVAETVVPIEGTEETKEEGVQETAAEVQTEFTDTADPVLEVAPEPISAAEVSGDATETVGDISMLTDPGAVIEAIGVAEAASVAEPTPVVATTETAAPTDAAIAITEPPAATETAEPAEQEIAQSTDAAAGTVAASDVQPATETSGEGDATAENAAAAPKTRTRRRSSVSSVGSADDQADLPSDISVPSLNRVSILYEESSRRLCFDAEAVNKVKIFREEGKIEVDLRGVEGEAATIPKGLLVEIYDTADQRFISATTEKLSELCSATGETVTVPPLHKSSAEGMTVTVYLNKKRPLSEPKWCKTNSCDEWLIEQFGSRTAASEGGWKGKLEIIDPEPAPTLENIVDGWTSSCSHGTADDRKAFTASLLSNPSDLLEILLRLARSGGDRSSANNNTAGPLATAIRPDSPYASHQTHVSLAILAMYRLTTDYAEKAGEKSSVVNEKISDIIKSLPVNMIHRSLDGLFREWGSGGKK